VATFGPLGPAFYVPEVRLKAMDKQKMQVQALSLTAPMVYLAEPSLGIKLARAWNDATAEMAGAWPDRFVVLATLPMQDPEAAVSELNRAVRELGCRCVYAPTCAERSWPMLHFCRFLSAFTLSRYPSFFIRSMSLARGGSPPITFTTFSEIRSTLPSPPQT
jgi:hypothetical protein